MNLKTLVAQATPRPWTSTEPDDEGHYDIEHKPTETLVASGAGFYGKAQPFEANRHLITHSVNVLPGCVNILAELIDSINRHPDWEGNPSTMKRARAILKQARNVNV